jgi:phage terminase large subunit
MEEKQEEQKGLVINPVFEPVFIDEIDTPRYYQLYGGRGSGKSFVAAIAMVKLTYSKYKHKILYLRQTMASSDDSVVADIKAAIEVLGVAKDFREKGTTITNIKTGSTIAFKGIRSSGTATAKLKSLSGITTLVVEEAEEVESFEEFSKVDESIRVKGKPLKIILIYNPTSALKSWIHSEWFIEGRPNLDRYEDSVFMHSTYIDNEENLNKSVVKRYKDLERTNPTYYKNTILAEWTLDVSGRLYAGWGMFDELEEEGDTWYAIDFGYGGKDSTACVKITWIDDVYYVEELFCEAKLSMRKTISLMRKSEIPFNAKIYADSAMPLLIEEIRSGGFRTIRKATKGNVEAGIKKVQNKDIVMVGGDKTHLYYAYMTFGYDKNNKLPHEPDILAALRYGINSRIPTKNSKKNKPVKARRTNRGDFI